MSHQPDPDPCKEWAAVLAMFVRNALEDLHAKHIPDSLMPELNKTIRDAIYTGLYAGVNANDEAWCAHAVAFAERMIPEYWEPAEFLPEVARAREHWGAEPPTIGKEPDADPR